MYGPLLSIPDCPGCGVAPGELHIEGCEVETCPACGGQYTLCQCNENIKERLPWEGPMGSLT